MVARECERAWLGDDRRVSACLHAHIQRLAAPAIELTMAIDGVEYVCPENFDKLGKRCCGVKRCCACVVNQPACNALHFIEFDEANFEVSSRLSFHGVTEAHEFVTGGKEGLQIGGFDVLKRGPGQMSGLLRCILDCVH